MRPIREVESAVAMVPVGGVAGGRGIRISGMRPVIDEIFRRTVGGRGAGFFPNHGGLGRYQMCADGGRIR